MLFLTFDIESDGLYGEAFAVGAVVVDDNEAEIDRFSGVAEMDKVESEWVKQNCIPYLHEFPVYPDRKSMRDAFWKFYMKYRSNARIVSDVPVPVEASFLRACVMDDPENRMFLAPYPLIDVASVLFAAGMDPNMDRTQFGGGRAHNPLDDALNSYHACRYVLKKIRETGA